ncbi:MAG: DUF2312 domain-containing protein [Magnetococcales bacterium]|nr:DUF2312 domain-containing protein [Magnetococcales bacterium]
MNVESSEQDVTHEELIAFIDRIERLEEEKAVVSDHIKTVYAEAKSSGFDTKALREVIKRRKLDRNTVEELDSLVEMYEQAITK